MVGTFKPPVTLTSALGFGIGETNGAHIPRWYCLIDLAILLTYIAGCVVNWYKSVSAASGAVRNKNCLRWCPHRSPTFCAALYDVADFDETATGVSLFG